MKNIIRIIIFICAGNLQAQEGVTVPLGTLSMDVQNGTYIQDVNEVFNPFIGTYIGYWNNKKFTLVLQKIEHVTISSPNGDYYYKDRMVGNYEIVNQTNNSVLYSTMNATEYDDFPIVNVGGVYNGELDFNFFDTEERCKNSLRLSLDNMTNQSGVITVRYYCRTNEYYEYVNCPYPNKISIPQVLPSGFLTLTKVD